MDMTNITFILTIILWSIFGIFFISFAYEDKINRFKRKLKRRQYPFRFKYDLMSSSEILDWCVENKCKIAFFDNYIIGFKHKKDAMAFKLRWM